MQAKNFIDVVKLICQIASIDFINALAEISYWEQPYSEYQIEKLKEAIDEICNELTKAIFGNQDKLDEKYWLIRTRSQKINWLFSFGLIQEKIFTTA